MVKNTPCLIPTIQLKNSLAKFLIATIAEKALPLNAILKSMNFPFAKKKKKGFLGKKD